MTQNPIFLGAEAGTTRAVGVDRLSRSTSHIYWLIIKSSLEMSWHWTLARLMGVQ